MLLLKRMTGEIIILKITTNQRYEIIEQLK